MSDRMTFRPGDLAGPLAAWCAKHGRKPSEALRIAVAAMLGVEVPDMPQGNPRVAEQAKAAAAARWKRTTKRKRRK